MNRRIVFFLLLNLVFLLPASLGMSGFQPGRISDERAFTQATPKPQGPLPDDNAVNRVARQMYCPVCENIPLDVCPTQACNEWRELIRLRLSQGWSDEQIKEYFVVQYGDRVLAEPPRRGFNWLIYILPPIFLLGGMFILYRVLAAMRKKPEPQIPADQAAGTIQPSGNPTVNLDEIYLRRLEEELKKKG